MTNEEAIRIVRELGHNFAVALAEKVGKKPKSTSDLMNGLVAYNQLTLKGEFEELDEAVDKVMRIIYETMVERVEQDTLKIGR